MVPVETRNKAIKELLNGMFVALKTVVPIEQEISKPQLLKEKVDLQFGVLIGITGDVKGQLVITGDKGTFASIGETMYGMPLDGEMLASFSGELGNMLAGRLSTIVAENGVHTDITSPTILEGNTHLSGYKQALKVNVRYDRFGETDIYLLLA